MKEKSVDLHHRRRQRAFLPIKSVESSSPTERFIDVVVIVVGKALWKSDFLPFLVDTKKSLFGAFHFFGSTSAHIIICISSS